MQPARVRARPIQPCARQLSIGIAASGPHRFFEDRFRDDERFLEEERFFDDERFFEDDFLDGTFAPFCRASDNPMAIACLRLVTFFPERPLRSVPFFFRCIALLTLFCELFP